MKEGMDFFFNWMAKPMNRNDVDLWFRANNIQIEYSNLFKKNEDTFNGVG